jgi:hypothetical protein
VRLLKLPRESLLSIAARGVEEVKCRGVFLEASMEEAGMDGLATKSLFLLKPFRQEVEVCPLPPQHQHLEGSLQEIFR